MERVTDRWGQDLEDFTAAIIHSHDPLLTDRMISNSPECYREENQTHCLNWDDRYKGLSYQTDCIP